MNAELAAKDFANEWYERGDEDRHTQNFWNTLLRDVFGVDKPEKIIEPNYPVKFAHSTGHIDIFIPRTKVIIEQKSFGVDLDKKILQSDGELLTPYEQAKRYADTLPADKKPRWIVTCNFAEFRIYNLTKNLFEPVPTIIKLRELRYQFPRLKFLIDPTADDSPPEEKISKKALKVITNIYDAFAKNYRRNKVVKFEDALNKICTRLVFCLYAEDAQLFNHKQFFAYLSKFDADKRLDALQRIFDVLNTPENKRPENLDDDLKSFPYVDGGLFDEKILFPTFSVIEGDTTKTIFAANIKEKFSWREISPPVFGAMFESTFSRENRQRKGGMYYTSEDNIRKVIDPLFLDDLRTEFEIAKRMHLRNRSQALCKLQDKLAALKFLDPACGSGNFLTKTYLELRRLENEILEELRPLVTLPDNPVKVSINQFFGIEIDPFAVAVAKVALWIAEIQMLQETEGALGKNFQALPLKNYATIVCANANQIDWSTIVAPANVDYIIGNPPFHGYSEQTPEQKAEMRRVFPDNPKAGKMDYVCAWYQNAADFIRGTKIRCGFVSTNSVTQGEQVAYLWEKIFNDGVHIDFAHRTFKWLSDSDNMAHVHCVVVGFSKAPNDKDKIIFDGDKVIKATNINAYLVDGENIIIKSRRKHFQAGVPKMVYGNKPADDGNLIIEADDIDVFLRDEPAAEKFVRLYLGAEEFIDGLKRYCLWLVDVPEEDWRKLPLVAERVEACATFRLASPKPKTNKDAERPTVFQEIRQPTKDYMFIPRHSSGNRKYIPIGFMPPTVIASDAAQFVPDATTYHFGVLTSSTHMAWMRATCGRLKSDYRYSKDIVYNNFPWPTPTPSQRQLIERSAQMILDVRAKFSGWTFAKLYDEDTMPDELRDAHVMNDTAVARAYGFEKFLYDEARVVAELMKLYAALA